MKKCSEDRKKGGKVLVASRSRKRSHMESHMALCWSPHCSTQITRDQKTVSKKDENIFWWHWISDTDYGWLQTCIRTSHHVMTRQQKFTAEECKMRTNISRNLYKRNQEYKIFFFCCINIWHIHIFSSVYSYVSIWRQIWKSCKRYREVQQVWIKIWSDYRRKNNKID